MTKPRMRYVDCPCGTLLEGQNDDLLVAAVQEHLQEKHPHLSYDHEQILMLAY